MDVFKYSYVSSNEVHSWKEVWYSKQALEQNYPFQNFRTIWFATEWLCLFDMCGNESLIFGCFSTLFLSKYNIAKTMTFEYSSLMF